MEAIVNAIIIVVAEENTLINTTTMAINIIKEVIKVVLDFSVQKVFSAQVVSLVVKHV